MDATVADMDPNVRWLVVTNAQSTEALERYLYNTAKLFAAFEEQHLVVVATRHNVDFIINYQAERLRSGLMGATIHGTFADAMEALS